MLAAEIPSHASAKKDGKDAHAHRVRLLSFLPLHPPGILGVSGRELLAETKQVYGGSCAKISESLRVGGR